MAGKPIQRAGKSRQIPHHSRHGQRRSRRFGPAVMVRSEATGGGLLAVLQQQHLVNDRDFVLELELRQGVADRFADVLGMGGGASQDHSQAKDC